MQSSTSPSRASGSRRPDRPRRTALALVGGEPSGPLAEIGQNLALLGISVAVTAAATVLSHVALGLLG